MERGTRGVKSNTGNRTRSRGSRLLSFLLSGVMLAGSIPANTITAMASDTVIFADSGDMEGYTGETPVQESVPAEQNNSDDLVVYDSSADMIEEDYRTDPSGSMVFTHGGEDEGEPAQDQLTEKAAKNCPKPKRSRRARPSPRSSPRRAP